LSLRLNILSSFCLLCLFPARDISFCALSTTTNTNKPLKIGREVLDLDIVLAWLISRASSLYCIGDFAFCESSQLLCVFIVVLEGSFTLLGHLAFDAGHLEEILCLVGGRVWSEMWLVVLGYVRRHRIVMINRVVMLKRCLAFEEDDIRW
jgi:hypothetical protein